MERITNSQLSSKSKNSSQFNNSDPENPREKEMSEESALAGMEFDSNAVNSLANLRLDSQSPDLCTKKRFPFSSSLDEPSPKRVSIRPPSPPTKSLFRCSSLPVDYPALNDVAALNPHLHKQTSTSPSVPSPFIRRTSSCPISPPPSARKSLKEISPTAKRLKIMNDTMKEMKKWCEELILEDAEFEEDEAHLHQLDAESNESQCEPIEPAAWVEKTGESSIIHFKCPCTKDYQILLHDSNCYYLLMPFDQEKCDTETQEMLSVERNGKWLTIYTQCPCSKGYMILLAGKECYFKLIDNLSSSSSSH